ncbi:MAG: bifunctional DNA-formamidopyrimidine glycosylase/DNA-(apurinic or apyrimidinic site) lyase [Firmicutes bacterium]|nr:bifunctional DNA-formamidopyrimidine glycosylase/DNA-(apurinic or apyrimidinic site) lyase [Bacillota bacterium]
MPELPEVETICRTLRPHLEGQVLGAADLLRPEIWQNAGADTVLRGIRGRAVQRVLRRGKYIVWELEGGPVLVLHLRMTGHLFFVAGVEPAGKYTAAVFWLDSGGQVHFEDVRRFGVGYFWPQGDWRRLPPLCDLGVEPLSGDFTPAFLAEKCRGSRRTIKSLLMDQQIVAGIGNIYADEALFTAGIHPARPAGSLALPEIQRLQHSVVQVLQEAIQKRGTSIRNYADGEGNPGQMQDHLKVYGREGEACARCGHPLQRMRVGGRSSVFCPRCQPETTPLAGQPGARTFCGGRRRPALDPPAGLSAPVPGRATGPEPAAARRAPAGRTGLLVGLTGGIASGKSTVSRLLQEAGVPVVDADQLAHAALEPGTPVYRAVLQRFGTEILAGSEADTGAAVAEATAGTGPAAGQEGLRPIDRRRLGELVFSDAQARRDLEALVHPWVQRQMEEAVDAWRRRRAQKPAEAAPVLVLDVPLLFEAGWDGRVDQVVVVYAPPEVQLRRLQERDGLSLEQARQRLRAQWPLEDKVRRAHVVIQNGGTVEETRRQVEELLKRWGMTDDTRPGAR